MVSIYVLCAFLICMYVDINNHRDCLKKTCPVATEIAYVDSQCLCVIKAENKK